MRIGPPGIPRVQMVGRLACLGGRRGTTRTPGLFGRIAAGCRRGLAPVRVIRQGESGGDGAAKPGRQHNPLR